MYCPTLACSLGVFAGPGADVEAQLDQVRDVVGLGVGGVGSYSHNGVNNSQGGIFSPLDWGILNPIYFELPGESLVETGVSL